MVRGVVVMVGYLLVPMIYPATPPMRMRRITSRINNGPFMLSGYEMFIMAGLGKGYVVVRILC